MYKQLGLSTHEASKRLRQYGNNEITPNKHTSGIKAYLSRFKNPLVIILALASILSFFLGEIASGIIIVTIVLISTTLDFFNTYRSEKAAAALQKTVRVTAKVMRDQKIKLIALSHIVPGDIITLEAGSLIPADGKIVATTDLAIDESALTGESFPIAKQVDDLVYMGSNATSGNGQMLVTATGKSTEFARIASSIQKPAVTEFDLEIARFSALISRITLGLVIFILAVSLLFKHNAVDALLFSLALAVGLTPELLPLIITINLTKGSLRMAKHGVIVKKLSAIQNFGSMDVLCTDKTGTLTENKISVALTKDFHETDSPRTLDLAAVACKFSTSYESPLDLAILNYKKYSFKGYKKVQEIPFDFQRKRESVVVNSDGNILLISKGAADEMMGIITAYRDKNGEPRRMTMGASAKLRESYQDLSRNGYRVLAIATKSLDPNVRYSKDDESYMTFEGFIGFIDPPKATAKKSVGQLASNGIEVKVITGDDPLVSQKVANELGLPVKGLLTGSEIAKMNHLQLERKVGRTTIFARVNPSQKLAVIEALRRTGHVVGYMGDGINDAPSLRAADIGISVNNAVDVAKETADMILMGKSLNYLNQGVVEGRRTFANTMKYLKMSLSSNFGNMFSMAGASLFLPFLPMTAPQILLNNLLYDSSQFALPGDNVDEDQIKSPQKMDIKSIKRFMWVFGPLSSLFDFITFGILLLIFHASASEFQTGWFIESLLTQTLVVFIIRTKRLAILSHPSRYLILAIVATITVACAIIFSFVGQYFGFSAQPIAQVGSIIAIVTIYLLVTESVKQVFYRFTNSKI